MSCSRGHLCRDLHGPPLPVMSVLAGVVSWGLCQRPGVGLGWGEALSGRGSENTVPLLDVTC